MMDLDQNVQRLRNGSGLTKLIEQKVALQKVLKKQVVDNNRMLRKYRMRRQRLVSRVKDLNEDQMEQMNSLYQDVLLKKNLGVGSKDKSKNSSCSSSASGNVAAEQQQAASQADQMQSEDPEGGDSEAAEDG